MELCTLPVTWVQKHRGQDATIPKGKRGRGICPWARNRGLPARVGECSVRLPRLPEAAAAPTGPVSRLTWTSKPAGASWRTAHNMGEQLVFNKPAITEMDKNPAYWDPGETWGKNKITILQWDYLEEGSAILSPAADASQFLEDDKYPTASLVVPMTYALMKTSSISEDVKFRDRAADEFNDPSVSTSSRCRTAV